MPVLIYDFDIHIETTEILYKILAAVVYKWTMGNIVKYFNVVCEIFHGVCHYLMFASLLAHVMLEMNENCFYQHKIIFGIGGIVN